MLLKLVEKKYKQIYMEKKIYIYVCILHFIDTRIDTFIAAEPAYMCAEVLSSCTR